MGLITMSDKEVMRLKVMQDLVSRHLAPAHAAVLLTISTRQDQ
jgi:hypothetical protein